MHGQEDRLSPHWSKILQEEFIMDNQKSSEAKGSNLGSGNQGKHHQSTPSSTSTGVATASSSPGSMGSMSASGSSASGTRFYQKWHPMDAFFAFRRTFSHHPTALLVSAQSPLA
jgi:hypothetical protein